MTIVQQNIFGLDVAMNHTVPMCVAESTCDFVCYAQCVVDGKLALTVESCAKRFTFDIRHYVEQLAFDLPRIEQWENVRMLKSRSYMDLRQESLGAEYGGELGEENFYCDLSSMPQIFREVDGRHAPFTKLALDAVPLGESGRQTISWASHLKGVRIGVFVGDSMRLFPHSSKHQYQTTRASRRPVACSCSSF